MTGGVGDGCTRHAHLWLSVREYTLLGDRQTSPNWARYRRFWRVLSGSFGCVVDQRSRVALRGEVGFDES